MSKAHKVFQYDVDIHGARVKVGEVVLTQSASADSEVDYCIQQLKDDLDAIASEMKKAIKIQAQKPDF